VESAIIVSNLAMVVLIDDRDREGYEDGDERYRVCTDAVIEEEADGGEGKELSVWSVSRFRNVSGKQGDKALQDNNPCSTLRHVDDERETTTHEGTRHMLSFIPPSILREIYY
jgi:hypothetical protein